MFCDFCDCEDCKTGSPGIKNLLHAQTVDGKWICDVCFTYDECVRQKRITGGGGPCETKDCNHRPKLVSGWSKA
jgi:hypothetical protein